MSALVACSCAAGSHWGPLGAAGLLLFRSGEVLLQRRSQHVHEGGTWSIPGGAIAAGEDAHSTALRETAEEIDGLDLDLVTPTGEHVERCEGGWTYTTIVATYSGDGPVTPRTPESDEVRWLPVAEVSTLPLHPGLEDAMPSLARRLGVPYEEPPSIGLSLNLDLANLNLNPFASRRRHRFFVTQSEIDDYQAALTAGDPVAVETYHAHQRRLLADVREEDLLPWPDEITSGGTLTIPESEPLYGYRYWAVRGLALVAPYMTTKAGLSRKAPGVEWRTGVNESVSIYCDVPGPVHPHPDCHCGIRAMQARTALDVFAREGASHFGAPGAVAKVAVWGTVTGGRDDDDDWLYTLRASHARIVGPIDLAPEHERRRASIERKYGIEKGGRTLSEG